MSHMCYLSNMSLEAVCYSVLHSSLEYLILIGPSWNSTDTYFCTMTFNYEIEWMIIFDTDIKF